MGRLSQRSTTRARRFAPFVVVAISLLATATASRYVQLTAREKDLERFRDAVVLTEVSVQRRMDAYIAILRATAGVFANETFTPDQFRAYVDRLQLRETYPGTLGIGYATRVRADELHLLIAWMRAHGDTRFHVWPISDGEMYPIKYLEPRDIMNERAVGFDMFSESVRRDAMERARDSGRAAASGKVTLVQESGAENQPGFLIYLPVYRGGRVPLTIPERRERIIGFAYAPLRIQDMLDGILGAAEPQVEFQIFQGTRPAPESFLYDSDPVVGPDNKRLRSVSTIQIGGQPWTFVYSTRPIFLSRSDLRLVPVVVSVGAIVTVLLFGITLALSSAWASAERSAADLRRSRDELRGLAERFRVALKNAPITVYNTDMDLRYTWLANAEQFLGAGTVIGKRDEQLLPPDEAAPLVALKQQVLRSGVGVRRELPLWTGGVQRFFDLTIEPLRDEQGRMTGLTVAAIDVTDLRNAYEQFRLASRAVRSLIYDWDPRADRMARSDGLVELLGTRPEEAEPRSEWWWHRVHPEDLTHTRQALRTALQTQDRYVLEYRVRHKNGRWVDVWDHGIIVRGPDGQAVRVVGNAMNVSNLKDAQRAQARHAEALARSNADLEDFAYVASHDLKEPLRGIANYARFLEEDQGEALGAEGLERVRTIQRLAQHMYRLLDSLLEYSRVGRTELAVREVDLGEVVREVVSGLEPWLEQEAGVVRIAGELPTVRADRVRVGQVFSNLITNGVKYNVGRERIVEIGAARGDDGQVVVYVRDNGIGIPARHRPKLFHMFKRLHARSQYGGGTGSGLAIVKKIIERHGGRIWLESEPGKGTTFYFTLEPGNGHTGSEGRARPVDTAAAR